MAPMHAAGKVVFLFSGQGAQHFHMARALFEANAVFRVTLQQLDATLCALGGDSVLDALYAPQRTRGETFQRLALTHPAIFMVEVALARAVIAAGLEPDFTLGASLGSFAAAVVSGCADAEQMLAVVLQQAAALEACCDGGAMLAVLAAPETLAACGLAARGAIAAYNLPAHCVLALPRQQCEAVEAELRSHQLAYQRLPVEYAFHSPWIDAAEAPFASYLATQQFDACRTPLFCCDRVETLAQLPAGFFWSVVRRPIRLQQAVAALERELPAARFVDLGPSGSLATFLRHLLPRERRAAVHAVLSPYGNDRTDLGAFAAGVRTLQ